METQIFIIFFIVIIIGCTSDSKFKRFSDEIIWAIDPQYNDAYGFSTGISVVKKDDKYCFINKSQCNVFNEEYVYIQNYYSDTKLFTNQTPIIKITNISNEIFLNRMGKYVDPINIATNIAILGPEIRIAMSDNWQYGLINVLDQWIIEPVFDAMKISDDGTPIIKKDGKSGFINNNKIVFLSRNISLTNFIQEIAMVSIYYGKDYTDYNFINKNGDFLFNDNIKDEEPKHRDGIVCYIENGLYGYKNFKNEILIPPQYKSASIFSDGLASVVNKDNKIGYINIYGDIIISFVDGINGGKFENNMASFTIKTISKNKKGVINKKGDWIIKPIYDYLYYYNKINVWELIKNNNTDIYYVNDDIKIKNLSLIKTIDHNYVVGFKGEKTYIININNGIPIWNEYDIVLDYSEGLFPVKSGKYYGYVDIHGTWLYTPQFDDARSFSEGLAAVKLNGKWGFIANPLIYDKWVLDEWERGAYLGLYNKNDKNELAFTEDLLKPISIVMERITREHIDILEARSILGFDEIGTMSENINLTREDAAVIVASAAKYCGFRLEYLRAF